MEINQKTGSRFVEESVPFLQYLEQWMENLPALALRQAALDPEKTAIISVDVIKGFCSEGPLASPRVNTIVEPITHLFERAWEYGVRKIVLTQDTHEPEAVEFAHFGAHCVRGTSEAETVDAFKALPFFDQMVIFEKNSISSGLNTGLNAWVSDHPDVDTFIVVGDCTDLCTYQLAMHLRLEANARQLRRRVILPVDCVNTYDVPLQTAQELGIMPHPGDFLHAVFLYHMQLNGIEVISKIA